MTFDEIHQQVDQEMWHWIETDAPSAGYQTFHCEFRLGDRWHQKSFGLHSQLVEQRPDILDMMLESTKRSIAQAVVLGEEKADA